MAGGGEANPPSYCKKYGDVIKKSGDDKAIYATNIHIVNMGESLVKDVTPMMHTHHRLNLQLITFYLYFKSAYKSRKKIWTPPTFFQ